DPARHPLVDRVGEHRDDELDGEGKDCRRDSLPLKTKDLDFACGALPAKITRRWVSGHYRIPSARRGREHATTASPTSMVRRGIVASASTLDPVFFMDFAISPAAHPGRHTRHAIGSSTPLKTRDGATLPVSEGMPSTNVDC